MSNLNARYIVLLAVAVLISSTAVNGQDTWVNPAGGFFDSAPNWADGSPPTNTEDVEFNLDASYGVIFDNLVGDITNRSMTVSRSDLSFLSQGDDRRYSFTADVDVDNATLRVGNSQGSGMTLSTLSNLFLQDNSSLFVESSGRVEAQRIELGSRIPVGFERPVSMTIRDGGSIDTGDTGVTNFRLASSVLVTGGGSSFDAGRVSFYSFGQSRITVENGASFQGISLFGQPDSGSNLFVVKGGGSTANVGFVGGTGVLLESDEGGAVNATQISLGMGSRVLVNGAGTTLTCGNFSLMQGADFLLLNGGQASTGDLFFGGDSGDSGLLASAGELTSSGTIEVGRGASGTITLVDSTLNAESIDLHASGKLSVGNNSMITVNELRAIGGELILNSGTINVLDDRSSLFLDQRFRTSSNGLDGTTSKLNVAGQVVIADTVQVAVSGAGIEAGSIVNNGTLVAGENTVLGNASRHDGFGGRGSLRVRSTTTLADAGLAELGALTTLGEVLLDGQTAGILNAANGVSLNAGSVLQGFGSVNGRVAASNGSAIYASGGDLTVGDAAHVAGFDFGGELYTGANRITVLDANQARLGSYTELGDGSGSGYLDIDNGAIIDFGENLVGYGTIDNQNTLATAFINNGAMIGNSIDERLIVEGYVKGIGTFENVQFNGTFSPGLSPTITQGTNFFFGDSSVLEMEIGGLIPGEEHDAIWASELLSLDGTLEVLLINGFNPELGDSFDLFDWGTINGEFASYELPTLDAGLRWNLSNLYTTGNLSVSAVPEPGSIVFIGMIGVAAGCRRRRVPA